MQLLLIFCLFVALNGCATTGPAIPSEELKAIEKEVEDLSSRRYVEDLARIWKVEYKILKTLPAGEIGRMKVGMGALIIKNSDKIAKAFGILEQDECLIAAVAEGGPAELAGLKPFDIIKSADDKEIEGPGDLELTEDRPTRLIVKRNGEELAFEVIPEEIPYIKISLKEIDKINAFAKFTGIEVTRGMLRFVENDDELGVIIGHEIAHVAHMHLPKNMAVAGLCGLVGGLTGPFAGPVTQALYAPYCRENEREADYFGLLYAHKAGYDIERGIELWKRFAIELPKSRSTSFLRTHPATPERILRVKKVMEMVRGACEEWDRVAKETEGQ